MSFRMNLHGQLLDGDIVFTCDHCDREATIPLREYYFGDTAPGWYPWYTGGKCLDFCCAECRLAYEGISV